MALQPFDLSDFLAFLASANSTSASQQQSKPNQHCIHQQQQACSTSTEPLTQSLVDTCRAMAACLRATSALIVRDPRCRPSDNDRFIDVMESYFERPRETKLAHSRPELHYQVGVTPEGVEMPQSAMDEAMRQRMENLPDESRPHAPTGPDCKWRFMWRVGERPKTTHYKELNASPVVPEGFPDWSAVMDNWGTKMVAAVEVVSQMLAVGFDLPQDAFTSLMHQGPHLLAPTGSDLQEHNAVGTVLAGYHSDLNFLTIHGKCRYPGLRIWLRDGSCQWVSVPDGCLLLQAGKQMEWLTGGEVPAGMHEVVVTDATVAAIQQAKDQGRSLWRVSSTVFGHIASDAILKPLGHFASIPLAASFPSKHAGEFVEEELATIQLKSSNGG